MGQLFPIYINIYFLNYSLWEIDLNPTDKKGWPRFCIWQTLSANCVHISEKNGPFEVEGVCFYVDTTENKKRRPFYLLKSSKFWQKWKKDIRCLMNVF